MNICWTKKDFTPQSNGWFGKRQDSFVSVGKGDIETRLKKLDDLKKKNIITQKEYDAKRKDILNDI